MNVIEFSLIFMVGFFAGGAIHRVLAWKSLKALEEFQTLLNRRQEILDEVQRRVKNRTENMPWLSQELQ